MLKQNPIYVKKSQTYRPCGEAISGDAGTGEGGAGKFQKLEPKISIPIRAML